MEYIRLCFEKELQALLIVNATGFEVDMMVLRNPAGLLYPKIGGTHMRSGSACYRYWSFKNRLRNTQKKKRKRKSLSINRKEKHKKQFNVKRIQNERKFFFVYFFPRHLRIDLSIPALHCTGIVCVCVFWSTWALDKQHTKNRLRSHTNRTILCNSNIQNTHTGRRSNRQASILPVAHHQTVHGTCAWRAVCAQSVRSHLKTGRKYRPTSHWFESNLNMNAMNEVLVPYAHRAVYGFLIQSKSQKPFPYLEKSYLLSLLFVILWLIWKEIKPIFSSLIRLWLKITTEHWNDEDLFFCRENRQKINWIQSIILTFDW